MENRAAGEAASQGERDPKGYRRRYFPADIPLEKR